ncbi:MAG: HAD family phosphatase [Vampirovibrionales bacterium]|nr:HAD family phosphatase [Vampirovibrionales bacterium]
MAYRLLALDLDGTVLGESLKPTSAVREAIRVVQTQTEVRVVIATGRMFRSALPIARDLGLAEPLIAYQGALAQDVQTPYERYYHSPIPLGLARQILAFAQTERLAVNLYVDDVLYTNPENAYAAQYEAISGITPVVCDQLEERLVAPPSKMMIIEADRMPEIRRQLASRFEGRLDICLSRPSFCEIVNRDVSKWTALRCLADRWGIATEDIMAIGDQENDRSMIEQAGWGVAMGNAPETVKACANAVTRSVDEDGVAAAIERWLLPQAAGNTQQAPQATVLTR